MMPKAPASNINSVNLARIRTSVKTGITLEGLAWNHTKIRVKPGAVLPHIIFITFDPAHKFDN